LYDEDVTSVELFQKAVQLAPEKLSAATTTYSTYGETLMVDAQEGKKRGYIVRNAHGYKLAYHLSTLPGSSGSMIVPGGLVRDSKLLFSVNFF
jgi:hypothetical protein